MRPGRKPHDLSEHIIGAASQTPSAEPTPSLPARAKPHGSAEEQSHQPHQGHEGREYSDV